MGMSGEMGGGKVFPHKKHHVEKTGDEREYGDADGEAKVGVNVGV